MSDSLAPNVIVAKLIGALRGNAAGKRKATIKLAFVAAFIPTLFVCNVASAQVTGMASPTPTIGATSPLGIGTNSAVSPIGIPLGSTEIASPGVSPAPTAATGMISVPDSGTTCSTVGTSPSGMFGSTATFDGGGVTTEAANAASREARRECQRHREFRQPPGWKLPDCRACAAPDRAALLHRRRQRQRRRRQRAAFPEPEFRWDLPRSAISGSAPQRRYRW